ncbi:MAG TPA: DUF885 family protein, partial [Candidatus Berkiella sp.]|nr:DUF885 family protein [Candidatus Berkiella sp.]
MLYRLMVLLLLQWSIILSVFAMTPETFQQEVFQLATRYEQAYFKHYPEMGMFWGRADVAQDRFTDHSLNALLAWQKTEDEFLNALNAIPVKPLEGSAAFTTYQLLKQSLENSKTTRLCKDELWDVNPLHGWHNILTMIAEKQPIGSPQNRQNALKRWQGVPQIVNDEINNLTMGLQQGYIAPKPAVTRVLQQLTILLDTPIEKSPFFDFALRDGDVNFKNEMTKIIHQQIYPAMKHYADFLEKDYLPKARADIAVSALPGNIACYQSKIQKETTLTISPQAIYDFGREHMEQLKKEVAAIGQREFGTTDIATIFRLAKA